MMLGQIYSQVHLGPIEGDLNTQTLAHSQEKRVRHWQRFVGDECRGFRPAVTVKLEELNWALANRTEKSLGAPHCCNDQPSATDNMICKAYYKHWY